ncbi:hypothetical protein JQ615_38915 [Bradyrhizobium jicamae]|uniref:Uncharacterized protein n=1 Tax=Bradyrhizobium jicamae TaxID=280332 RepID=A0ABS5FWX2_9BRAD|nr:hypothetical protein [Bradyrhizobium jicamae]MBR0801336.1 hypothetical protein [Bradyrhizobium jicamae]MBR0937058.1 hypothetical protein [Bradyrhizobium jicamae]
MQPEEYLRLADHYWRRAKDAKANDRYQLRALADSYHVLAESARILERSAKVLDRLKQKKVKETADHEE